MKGVGGAEDHQSPVRGEAADRRAHRRAVGDGGEDDLRAAQLLGGPARLLAAQRLSGGGSPGMSRFHEADRGGYFGAWEHPELFAAELRYRLECTSRHSEQVSI
ncbi:hypothetical protein DAT35_37925 [Vitiosangium sp. GDMCC 1.1324]|nr:hypothetical protein DAT35_37925 [Vitiosangium sp. GDMCC 1.1324]